jgi:hypothetical protein
VGTRASRGAASSIWHAATASSWLASCRAVMSVLSSCAEVVRYLGTGQQTCAGHGGVHTCSACCPHPTRGLNHQRVHIPSSRWVNKDLGIPSKHLGLFKGSQEPLSHGIISLQLAAVDLQLLCIHTPLVTSLPGSMCSA